MSRIGTLLLVVALVWVPIFELAAWGATAYLASRGLMYAPAKDVDWDRYLRLRDPVTGWPPPSFRGQGEVDAVGSRLVPAFPDPEAQPACVSVYGDSFTFGDEVGPEDSYPNALATRLGCRVNNFGQGGFGTDQALLRYRDVMRDDRAPIVVLGHYSENIIRNVNQYRGFMAGTLFVNLKPRFVVDGEGALDLVPLPELTAEEFAEIGERHEELLPYEYFRPGGPAGIAAARFPHLLNLIRLGRNYRLRGWLDGVPTYAPFYAPDHDAGALAVTAGIVEEFVATARSRGQAPLVIVVPDIHDVRQLESDGDLPYDPLLERLEAAGIAVPGVAARLLAALDGRDASVFYTRKNGGHFNAEGYAALARVVADWIDERGLRR